jgi:hypothetical protein
MNDHDTDSIEGDLPSRRSRTPHRRIRLSAEDAARMQREAWSDVEPAEEKRTEGARFFAAFRSELPVIPDTFGRGLSVRSALSNLTCGPVQAAQ